MKKQISSHQEGTSKEKQNEYKLSYNKYILYSFFLHLKVKLKRKKKKPKLNLKSQATKPSQ